MARVKKIKLKGTPYDIYDNTAIHSLTKTMVVDALGYTPIQEDKDTKYTAASSSSMVATAAVTGTSTAYARADHVHGIAKATITAALGYTPPSENTTYSPASSVSSVNTTSAVGTSTAYARADHVHDIAKATITSALGYTPPTENTTYTPANSVKAVATTSAVGTSTAYARADHIHDISKATITAALGYTPPTENTTYSIVSKTANGLAPQLPNETTTTKYLRQDGTWQVPPDNDTDHMIYKNDNNNYPIALAPHISNNYGANNSSSILTPGYTDKIKVNPSTGHLSATTISAAAATTAAAGLMSAADKTKLEALVSGGDIEITQIDPAESAPPNISTTGAVGTSTAYARGNHTHGITKATITSALGYTPVGEVFDEELYYTLDGSNGVLKEFASNATPQGVGITGSAGTSYLYSRADHKHQITSNTITSALGYVTTAASNTFKAEITNISGDLYKLKLTQNS